MHIFADKGADMSAARDVAEQAAKGSIPATATAVAWLSSIPLDRWLLISTIVYTLLQTFVLVRDRIYKPWCRERVEAAAEASAITATKAIDGNSGQT